MPSFSFPKSLHTCISPAISSSITTCLSTRCGFGMDRTAQCWHCRKRRWKCDGGTPACEKCVNLGMACPGYSTTRPIRFRRPLDPSQFEAARPIRALDSDPHRHQSDRSTPSPTSNSSAELQKRRQPPARLYTLLGSALSTPGESSLIEGLEFMCLQCRRSYGGSYLENTANPLVFSRALRCFFSPDPRPLEIMVGIRVCSLLAYLEFFHSRLTQEAVVELKARLLEYTSVAYEMTRAAINRGQTHSMGAVAEGIHYLMFLEIMHVREQPIWQVHARAAAKLYLQEGVIESPTAAAFQFAMLMIVNNTTSPFDQQVCPAKIHEHIAWIQQRHEQVKFAAFASPWPLVAQIIGINRLRSQQGHRGLEKGDIHRLLNHIEGFDGRQWAATNTPGDYEAVWEWLGNVSQTAVAAFALASLSSHTPDVSRIARYRKRLFQLLHNPASEEYLIRFGLQWHFIVAGFLAKNGTVAQRECVRDYLQWSGLVGRFRTQALNVLERFWACDALTTWTDCFDKPYFFVGF